MPLLRRLSIPTRAGNSAIERMADPVCDPAAGQIPDVVTQPRIIFDMMAIRVDYRMAQMRADGG